MENDSAVTVSGPMQSLIESTCQTLKDTFDRYAHDEVFLSFNGGKDCTVLVHLLAQYMNKRDHKHFPILCIYVQPKDSFEEVEDFVQLCQRHFNIDMKVYTGGIKQALEQTVADYPKLRACIMGSRSTDPYCETLKTFQPTDPGWPPLMRVSPILSWTCDNVWEYLHAFKVPYCVLYERGYTSLGDKSNTIPNPHLRCTQADSKSVYYLPAYKLLDDRLERAGRL